MPRVIHLDLGGAIDLVTRLDGPVLFVVEGRVDAVARYTLKGRDTWYDMSSLLGRKCAAR